MTENVNIFRAYCDDNLFPRIEDQFGRALTENERDFMAALFAEGATFVLEHVTEILNMEPNEQQVAGHLFWEAHAQFVADMHLQTMDIAGSS